MKKTDARQWQYIKPLIKDDYVLKVIRKTEDEVYEAHLNQFRVRSIKLGKRGDEKGLLVITLAE